MGLDQGPQHVHTGALDKLNLWFHHDSVHSVHPPQSIDPIALTVMTAMAVVFIIFYRLATYLSMWSIKNATLVLLALCIDEHYHHGFTQKHEHGKEPREVEMTEIHTGTTDVNQDDSGRWSLYDTSCNWASKVFIAWPPDGLGRRRLGIWRPVKRLIHREAADWLEENHGWSREDPQFYGGNGRWET